MTTTTQLHTPYILDADWIAAIEEALATPATVPFAIEPCALASYDVMHGIAMRPEQFYRTVKDCEEYLISYKDAVQAWAARVNDANRAMFSDFVEVDVDEELAELVEDALDREYWARGSW